MVECQYHTLRWFRDLERMGENEGQKNDLLYNGRIM